MDSQLDRFGCSFDDTKSRQLVAVAMHPKNLSISEFTYELPGHRIANFPLTERDQSKLLIYKSSLIQEDIYKNISAHLPAESLLVFNNTKVIEARLLFMKTSGGVIEIFCLEPAEKNLPVEIALNSKHKVSWKCLVGGASKWKAGQVLEKTIQSIDDEIVLQARYIGQELGSFTIELSWTPGHLSFIDILHKAGAIPLPPYIKRKAEVKDAERYQTIYAKNSGSVAAPTAGLHFTENILTSLIEKNVETDFVTLHVGAGTFKPVKSLTMEDHEMHAEFIDVTKKFIEHLIDKADCPIVSVGTTSLRTIESLYWLGIKIKNGLMDLDSSQENLILNVGQWDPYENSGSQIPYVDSLNYLLDWMNQHKRDRILAKTQIIIAPGYKPKIVTALVTNFHQPQSTLLLLVASLIGKDWKKVYNYALEHEYRFLSYGDGCLLWVNED